MKNDHLHTAFFILILLTLASSLQAQRTIAVGGKSQILLNDSYCIGEVKRMAVDQAKINALETAYGRVIVQGTSTYVENIITGEKVKTNTKMNTIANSMVKGEWVKTKKTTMEWVVREKPKGGQELWLMCEIKGSAREIKDSKVDFEVFTMNCNNNPDKCKTEQFKSREELYMHFKTASKGYLSVFMEESGTVYRLLPYPNMHESYENAVPVKADQAYTLFSEKHYDYFKNSTPDEIMEYIMTTGGKSQLFNRIFVVFSKKAFKKPLLSNHTTGLKVTTPEKFQKWLGTNRAVDPLFQVKTLDITVTQFKK
ncbi:hypothetical protein [Microscilla marina]|uniref:DUF4384 domain-containing protein n=1 Tax=Microscilla marina ATCC 23134 TaxID=313606 RepID=A1ZFE2_MICM2|nr:hypothetical protein [Microscilla marina]EAY30716.1 hypothetical protein M23134_01040 [Microscilla marina ATCC 23134]